MSKTLLELNKELDAPIPRSAVSQRQGGGGRSLSYLAGWYVIDRLNKVFGPLNWACKTEMLQLVHQNEISVHYIAQVRIVVEGPDGKKTEHTCTGYGDGSDKTNIGKAHELAVKEAETDALKRCAKNLGMSMGLALYDKDQENVEDDAPKAVPKSAAPVTREKAPEPIRPSAPEPSRPSATGLHASRELLNKNISTIAKIALSKGRTDQAGLDAELKKYGAAKKEELSDENAQKLFDALKSLAG